VKNLLKAALLIAIFAAAILPAGANVLIGPATPQADAIQIPTLNYFGPGPQAYSNYTWTSTNATYQDGSVFGYTGGYGFAGNGSWDGLLGPMIGLNDSSAYYGVTDTMTLTFNGAPVYEIGDYFNYVPGSSAPTTLSVYGAGDVLLDTLNLNTVAIPDITDTGVWITFTETTAIADFTLTDNFVGFTDPYSLGNTTPALPNGPPAATPEPSSLLLLGTGIAGLGGLVRRKFAKAL